MSQIQPWMGRTQLLLGEHALEKLIDAHVMVVGLGGVGGICAEMIARAGVGRMSIVDADSVEESNRNRQIVALKSNDGRLKAEILAERIQDINPNIELNVYPEYIRNQRVDELLDSARYDYVVDCIDTLSPKVFLIKGCVDRNIPIVSSMGAGGKVDPALVQSVDVSETYNCQLAFYVRKRLRRMGIHKGVKVIWSPEEIDASRVVVVDSGPKKSIIGTMSYIPATFGIHAASVVIRDLYMR